MWGRKHLYLLMALFAPMSPAWAQCRLCDRTLATQELHDAQNGNVEIQVEAELNFDRLILAGVGVGAATIRPDGSSGAEGSVLEVGPRAMVGTVLVHGDANRAVRVDLPRRVELFSINGGRVTLDDVVTDLSGPPHLDAAGNLIFRFGGRLVLSGDADGPYRGDLPITVEYQ